MSKVVSTFLSVAVLVTALAALSIAVDRHGYAFGENGLARLEAITNAAMFMPLAAVFSATAVLMMILPLRGAGFVYSNAAAPVHWAVIVLVATMVGCAAARMVYGQMDAGRALLDWRMLFAVAIVGAHMAMTELRRNVLLRSLSFVAFTVATLACLFWSFRF
ncbi:hypothetical protein [Mesorhizobium sp. CAU 1732]|uniref:hypothetical protein n=1 Tax=Mesorhizobium sp. CAU 1732 TaxID=3140358 RepID=UPI003261471B